MKAFTVFMFEKMIPSGKVSDQNRKKGVEINYKAVKSIGEIYFPTTSIFEVNPLLLFPLNRDQSHFALGAIISTIKRDSNGVLETVSFNIVYLDSLHMQ